MSVRLRLAGKQEILEAIHAATKQTPVRVATPNPEFILEARSNPAFAQALAGCLCTVDGFGLQIGLWLWHLRARFKGVHRYAGADLVEDLLRRYSDGSKRFYLLGGEPGVAAQAGRRWKKRYPKLVIAGAEDGGAVSAEQPEVRPEVAATIKAAKPDILIIAYGMPKQELWMEQAAFLKVPVMIGVGGTFDFYVKKKRAPRVWQALRMEWLYRGFTEKGHWKRVWRAFPVYAATFAWSLVSGR